MRTVLQPGFVFVVGVAAVLAAGCSSYGGRLEVSGEVKLQGQPLSDASIQFLPLDGQDTTGGGPIENGAYKILAKDGLKPGNYLVRISSGDKKTPHDEDAGNPGGSTNIVSMDLIPADWNVQSKQQREVKAGVANKFDFDIPKVNKPKKK